MRSWRGVMAGAVAAIIAVMAGGGAVARDGAAVAGDAEAAAGVVATAAAGGLAAPVAADGAKPGLAAPGAAQVGGAAATDTAPAAAATGAGPAAWANATAPAPAAGAATAGAVARPPRIATSVFAAWPPFSAPVLSPDGLKLLARTAPGGQDAILVADLTGKSVNRIARAPAGWDINSYQWAGNGTVLIGVGQTVPWDGDEAYETRLLALDAASGAARFIGDKDEGPDGGDVVWVDPAGQRILLAMQSSIYEYPSVYSVDLATNGRHLVVHPVDDIWHWSADQDGIVRYGYGYSDSHHWTAVYRKNPGDSFRPIARNRDDREEGSDFDVLRIVQGSDDGYVYDNDEKTGLQAIWHFNFATRKRGDLVFEAPANDIDGAYTTDDGKTMESAWYTDDRPRVKWWDPAMDAFQTQLDAAVNNPALNGGVPGNRVGRVVSQSRDHALRLIEVSAANDPGTTYIYQEATGRMTVLAKANPALPVHALAQPRYVQYVARDGLAIHAYLTLPVGRAPKGLPLVVLPHGGPFWVRDDGLFNDDAQFLANRGYAVLQPEYRGSGSYGTAFHDKGKGQWGRAMQDDIDDGMDWLVKQGIADAGRACIVGISYGGYAAMWGATRNPERWRCAASLAGVMDVGRQVKYANNFDDDKHSRDDWRQTVQGDATFDLKTVSPLYTVDRLKVPVLVMHGDKDQRVLPKQSRLYAEALKAAGKVYEYYTIPDDGHGYTNAAAEQAWLDRLDAFLAKYNPAG